MKDLAALGRCYTQNISHKPKSRTLLFKQVRSIQCCMSKNSVKKSDILWYSKNFSHDKKKSEKKMYMEIDFSIKRGWLQLLLLNFFD